MRDIIGDRNIYESSGEMTPSAIVTAERPLPTDISFEPRRAARLRSLNASGRSRLCNQMAEAIRDHETVAHRAPESHTHYKQCACEHAHLARDLEAAFAFAESAADEDEQERLPSNR